MKFTKMQGCGNDYVYVDCTKELISNIPETARKVSNRNYGIGSDGLILIRNSDKADFMMEMYNQDGSRGMMCGNGIRCLGKYVYDHGLTDKTNLKIETLSGIKELELFVEDGKVSTVKVNMGAPILETSLIPAIFDKDKIINEPIVVGGDVYNVTCISMGNPHAVIYVDETETFPVAQIGPLFENHKMFPERVNTEFIQVLNSKHIKMRVWERGSGETLACGTGACASVVASVLNGHTENEVTVSLLGGDLLINYNQDNDTVYMTGPAVEVFNGEINL